jgi:hypothetical protein
MLKAIHRRLARAHGRTRVVVLSAVCLAALAAPAAATAEEGVVPFPGAPLSVFIGSRGECQSSYHVTGVNYYTAFAPEKGDCGFFLSFPKHVSQPLFLKEKVFGFVGNAGPGLGGESEYFPVSQSPVTGAGTGASPYSETTVYDVAEVENEKPKVVYAEVIDTTTYVAGAPQFTSTFNVTNKSGSAIFFRAIYAGDLYVAGNDFGVGSFLGGPPKFIGGLNTAEGILGGFIESTPWSAWQEGCWKDGEGEGTEGGRCAGDTAKDKGIWRTVQESATKESGEIFNDEADPAQIDNAAGVEWDAPLAGLANGAHTEFTIINHTEAPAGLSVSPANQTLTQGQTETVGVTALNTAGKPYAGGIVRYSVGGSNAQAGSITLNAAGQGQISYVGNNPGIDTIQMYLDIPNSGTQTATDPSASASVTFLPKPVANSTYTIKSIKANSNGTITITFVPTQAGQATLEVTVPTASISRAQAAKAKKCKKGQIKIHGKCLPANTVSGKVKANGVAGVPLTLSVKPSSKVKAALKKGRTVHLTATLTYKSALGGAPVVKVFHLTVKPPKHKHH